MSSVQGSMTARTVPMSRRTCEEVNNQPDWNLAFQSNIPINPFSLVKWILIVAEEYAESIDNLIRNMMKSSEPNKYEMFAFQIREMKADLIPTYVQNFDNFEGKDFQMLFVILPNERLDLYITVKKHLQNVEFPLACMSPNYAISKGLLSFATAKTTKACKKFGVEIRIRRNEFYLKNLMVVGFDVYRAKGSAITNGGMVCTISGYDYFSLASTHQSEEELASNFNINIKKCCNAYKVKLGRLPDKIIIFRGGVEGDRVHYIQMTELPQMLDVLQEFYGAEEKEIPKLSFIVVVVANTINRSMSPDVGQTRPDNPLLPTVIHVRYHFGLSSHMAQNEMKPTLFFSLYDTQDITPEQIMEMTYKLCRISFDCSGIAIVPVPCLMAHQLAFVVGISREKQAKHDAANNITFL